MPDSEVWAVTDRQSAQRILTLAGVIAVVFLVVSALPVAAVNTNLAVGSSHTTASDFNGATVLDNLTVHGSGSAGYVELNGQFYEGAEDGDTAEYTTTDNSESTYYFEAQSSDALSGSYALEQYIEAGSAAGDASERWEGLNMDLDPATTNQLEIGHKLYTYQDGNADYNATATVRVNATLDDGTTETVEYRMATILATPSTDAANLTFVVDSHNSESWATVSRDINQDLQAGGYANATEINWYEFRVTTPGSGGGTDIVGVRYDDVTFQDGENGGDTGTYISDSHEVSDAQQAYTNLTLQDATATVTWQEYSDGSWSDLRTDTYTTGGNKTVSLSPSTDTLRVNVTFDRQLNADAELHDEGVLFENRAPEVDNASADPQGGERINDSPVTLSIDVSDADFGSTQGEEVTVTFYDSSDGSTIGTDTLQSNGTASTTWDAVAGENQWYAVASDDYDGETTSETFVFETPSELYLRNENAPDELINDSVSVTVQFYSGDTVVTRETTDGTVNLSGIPADEQLVVSAEADGYHNRRIVISSLYEQQNLYLLNDSEASVEVRFELDDPTGQFPSSTILYIQRAINQSGTTEYRTIDADNFGVEGVTSVLSDGARYRIVIEGPDGTVQQIGPYRADVSETVQVRPGSPSIQAGNFTEGWATNATLDNQTLEVRYDDPEQLTDSVTVYIHERGNRSNQLRANTTYYDLGNFSASYSLSENESEKSWVVVYDVDRDGESFTAQDTVSNSPDLTPSLDREWRLIVGIGIMLISAGVFSVLNAGVGGVVVAMEGGVLWWLGWLEGATMGISVAVAIFVAVVVHLYQSSGP